MPRKRQQPTPNKELKPYKRGKHPIPDHAPIAPFPRLESDTGVFEDSPLESVVQIFAWITKPDFTKPWQVRSQKESTGSGFIISGRRIITNTHCVDYATAIQVRRHGCARKFAASVVALGFVEDVAVLSVSDDAFWDKVQPLAIADVPHLQSTCVVLGYPLGGDSISITQGVVSRVEVAPHQGLISLMTIQIDAAINPGNSGGPALQNGQVVGVAFSKLAVEGVDNIGYLIATPVLTHFLASLERPEGYTGICDLGLRCQLLENDDLRAYLGLPKDHYGLHVYKVEPLSGCQGLVHPGDVITSIDGHQLATDGTVSFRRNERVRAEHIVSQKFPGEACVLGIVRGGKPMELAVKASIPLPVIPRFCPSFPPTPLSYYIFGGLVFLPLTAKYYNHSIKSSPNPDLLDRHFLTAMDSGLVRGDEQILILSAVLASDVNMGYEDMVEGRLTVCNGVEVRNIRHLAHLLEAFLRSHHVSLDATTTTTAASASSTSVAGAGTWAAGALLGSSPPAAAPFSSASTATGALPAPSTTSSASSQGKPNAASATSSASSSGCPGSGGGGGFVVLEFSDRGKVVMSVERAKLANDTVMLQHRIRSHYSDDLVDVVTAARAEETPGGAVANGPTGALGGTESKGRGRRRR